MLELLNRTYFPSHSEKNETSGPKVRLLLLSSPTWYSNSIPYKRLKVLIHNYSIRKYERGMSSEYLFLGISGIGGLITLYKSLCSISEEGYAAGSAGLGNILNGKRDY